MSNPTETSNGGESFEQTLAALLKANNELRRTSSAVEVLNLPQVVPHAQQEAITHIRTLLDAHNDARRRIDALRAQLLAKMKELEDKREHLLRLKAKADRREKRIDNLQRKNLDKENPKHADEWKELRKLESEAAGFEEHMIDESATLSTFEKAQQPIIDALQKDLTEVARTLSGQIRTTRGDCKRLIDQMKAAESFQTYKPITAAVPAAPSVQHSQPSIKQPKQRVPKHVLDAVAGLHVDKAPKVLQGVVEEVKTTATKSKVLHEDIIRDDVRNAWIGRVTPGMSTAAIQAKIDQSLRYLRPLVNKNDGSLACLSAYVEAEFLLNLSEAFATGKSFDQAMQESQQAGFPRLPRQQQNHYSTLTKELRAGDVVLTIPATLPPTVAPDARELDRWRDAAYKAAAGFERTLQEAVDSATIIRGWQNDKDPLYSGISAFIRRSSDDYAKRVLDEAKQNLNAGKTNIVIWCAREYLSSLQSPLCTHGVRARAAAALLALCDLLEHKGNLKRSVVMPKPAQKQETPPPANPFAFGVQQFTIGAAPALLENQAPPVTDAEVQEWWNRYSMEGLKTQDEMLARTVDLTLWDELMVRKMETQLQNILLQTSDPKSIATAVLTGTQKWLEEIRRRMRDPADGIVDKARNAAEAFAIMRAHRIAANAEWRPAELNVAAFRRPFCLNEKDAALYRQLLDDLVPSSLTKSELPCVKDAPDTAQTAASLIGQINMYRFIHDFREAVTAFARLVQRDLNMGTKPVEGAVEQFMQKVRRDAEVNVQENVERNSAIMSDRIFTYLISYAEDLVMECGKEETNLRKKAMHAMRLNCLKEIVREKSLCHGERSEP